MRDIVVYVDRGVSGNSLRHTVKSLNREIDKERHCLKRMDAQALKSEPWEEKTDLLIIPGGRDVLYHEHLHGEGTKRIKKYIEGGGSYLGICAGAYFASSEIEFEKGGYLEVCGKRALSFFPGRAIGSALGPNKFDYETERGADAALIHWNDETHCFTYFNGGCFFDAPENHSSIDVLARYFDLETKPAAIVSCSVGKGKAILSGVHLEYCLADLVSENPYLPPIAVKLKKTETQRRMLFRQVLEQTGLALKA